MTKKKSVALGVNSSATIDETNSLVGIEVNGKTYNYKDAYARQELIKKEDEITYGLSSEDEIETINGMGIADTVARQQLDNIANEDLVIGEDRKLYIKQGDGTTKGTGVELPSTGEVTDEQVSNVIQAKIDDGTLSSITLGDNSVQESNIQNEAVTPNKTTFFSENSIYNLLNLGTIEVGSINSNYGDVLNHSAYEHSDYIEIPERVTILYRVSQIGTYNNANMACYDSNKTFLAGAEELDYSYNYTDSNGNTYFYRKYSLATGTKYVRTSFDKGVEVYLSQDAIPNGFDINQTEFVCKNGYDKKIFDAIGVPNLNFISRFKGKTMIVAGDSIVEKNTTANKVWHEYLTEWLDLTVYNDGQGGTGFAKNYNQRGSTIYRVENNWSELYPSNPDIVLIMGNQNDGTGGGGGFTDIYTDALNGVPPVVGTKDDDETVFSEYGIVRRLLKDLIEKYPNAKIGMISSTPRDNDITTYWADNPKSYGHGWYSDYVTAQKYVCEDLGIPFLDIYHQNPVLRPYNATNATTYYADGTEATGEATGAVHPNDLGHLYGIAIPVYNWLLTWL